MLSRHRASLLSVALGSPGAHLHMADAVGAGELPRRESFTAREAE